MGLVLLTLSLKELPGNGWRLIEAAVGVLAGVLAGVVVAGVLINPIKRWIEQAADADHMRREDLLWLDRSYAYARATHDALRHLVCLAADSLYQAFAATGALVSVVPSEALRWDVQRVPKPPPNLLALPRAEGVARLRESLSKQMEEWERTEWTGPMPTAAVQLQAILEVVLAQLDRERNAEVARIMGDGFRREPMAATVEVYPGQREALPDEQVQALSEGVLRALAAIPGVQAAVGLAALADRMVNMANGVAGTRDFDPLPLKKRVLAVQVRAERVLHMSRFPAAWSTGVDSTGGSRALDPDDVGSSYEAARISLVETSRLFQALVEVRTELFRATGKLTDAAVQLGGSPEPLGVWELPQDGLLLTDSQWELWRQRQGLFVAPKPERVASRPLPSRRA